MLGGGVSHPSQLTTGLVIKSVTTSPTLAGERMLFILQVSILSEQMKRYKLFHALEHDLCRSRIAIAVNQRRDLCQNNEIIY